MKTSVKDIVKSILDIFTHNVDEQQVLKDQMFDFFLVFSRFEFALKETGISVLPAAMRRRTGIVSFLHIKKILMLRQTFWKATNI
ncbi:hypothetical protein BTN99_23315 [Vibrio campbellii]|nr:hypothetical protein BTN99_23315 [Vibrio campbellii]